jgi:hypothetical protein
MIDALLLDCEQAEGGVDPLLKHPELGGRIDLLPMHDLAQHDLSNYRGLLISKHVNQRYLTGRKEQLEAYLRGGGAIVVCGHIAHPFLDELRVFVPIPGYTLADLEVKREVEHPIWAGVSCDDLTKRRGVAGFYGRGHNPPPDGALIVHTLGPARRPVDFLCRPAVGGRLLVHAGVDLWTYLDQDDSTAFRITPQLFDWLRGDAL